MYIYILHGIYSNVIRFKEVPNIKTPHDTISYLELVFHHRLEERTADEQFDLLELLRQMIPAAQVGQVLLSVDHLAVQSVDLVVPFPFEATREVIQ
jgi:hypothetical protein